MRVHVYIEAELVYFVQAKTNPVIYKKFLEDDIRCIVLDDKYIFDENHIDYTQLESFEIFGKGYTKEGKALENKKIINTLLHGICYDADDVKWENSTFSFRSMALYNKSKDNKLIAWINPECGNDVHNGTLTIQWNEIGVFSEEDINKQELI